VSNGAQTVEVEVDVSADVARLVRAAALKTTAKGTPEFGIAQIVQNATEKALDKSAPVVLIGSPTYKPTKITPAVTEALKRLPEVFGEVNPVEPRLLTDVELVKITRERQTIDVLLAVLKKRKDDEIRDILACHLDLVEEQKYGATRVDVRDEDGTLLKERTRTDKNGHYAVKRALPVPDAGVEVERRVSQQSPSISGARLLEAYEAGKISREDYLGLTRAVRVFDEDKARKQLSSMPLEAVRALREALEPGGVGTSIYVTSAGS
jgi:hypothetical protein